MQGEIEYFRKRFIGGYNRKDVIAYITKLAWERNSAAAEKEAAENATAQLRKELDELKRKLGLYETMVAEMKERAVRMPSQKAPINEPPAHEPSVSEPPAKEPPAKEPRENEPPAAPQKSVIVIKRRKK